MNPSRLPKPPKKVIQVVYRLLLKACENGAKPEVFGKLGSDALWSYWKDKTKGGADDAQIFPSTPEQVRKLLRRGFELDSSTKNDGMWGQRQADPIAALRQVNERSYILFPPESELSKAGIPVFDYYSSAALKGEELSLNFFEPRYLKLVREAMAGNGWFILRGRQILDTDGIVSASVLMKITEHATDGRNSFIQCTAGPRIRVLEQEEVPVVEENAPPMIRATHVVFYQDKDDCHLSTLESMRSKCLDLIFAVQPPKIVIYHGPPPLDPENFSFWVLRFIIDDAESKHEWLTCHSTSQRLQFALAMLQHQDQQLDQE
mmetsp:Transcript_14758/g.21769  ORF Transcript_14758/g.21769 Transcript_14758/m.21769 type:complete len:318 (-) Transcript_14758:852-1805(-)